MRIISPIDCILIFLNSFPNITKPIVVKGMPHIKETGTKNPLITEPIPKTKTIQPITLMYFFFDLSSILLPPLFFFSLVLLFL